VSLRRGPPARRRVEDRRRHFVAFLEEPENVTYRDGRGSTLAAYRSTMASEPTSSSNAPVADGLCEVGSRPIGRSEISPAEPYAPETACRR